MYNTCVWCTWFMIKSKFSVLRCPEPYTSSYITRHATLECDHICISVVRGLHKEICPQIMILFQDDTKLNPKMQMGYFKLKHICKLNYRVSVKSWYTCNPIYISHIPGAMELSKVAYKKRSLGQFLGIQFIFNWAS
jgi:hypothetical protein